jgi:hypothetical protein
MRCIEIAIALSSYLAASAAYPQAPKAGSGGGAPKAASGAPGPPIKAECSPVHFIIARGSNEPQGPGTTKTLADAVAKEIPGVTTEGVVYPARLNFSNILDYLPSSGDGAKAGVSQITQYVKACPQSKVVVAGLSQVRRRVALVGIKALD